MDVVDRLAANLRVKALPEPETRRALREVAEMTLQDVADVVGVSRGAVSHWETGTRSPRREYVAAYADLLDAIAAAADAK